MTKNRHITIGVLALQGGVVEHLNLLRKAAAHIRSAPSSPGDLDFSFAEVRTAAQLAQCDALIIPGGESTTMAIVARRLGLLDPLREFVKCVLCFLAYFLSVSSVIKRLTCRAACF
jgi:5'-phosphate synthase pdxT subunit